MSCLNKSQQGDICCFFFSSRRRHTRYWRDWSSDVCSSDLVAAELRGPHPRERGLSLTEGQCERGDHEHDGHAEPPCSRSRLWTWHDPTWPAWQRGWRPASVHGNCSGTLGLVAPGGGGLHPPCRSSVEVRRPAGGRSQARNSDPASPPARRPVATRRPPAQAPRPVYAVVDVMVMPAHPAAPMTRALAARAEL